MPEKTICIIPARGGSKGLPGKNLRPLAGRPLIAHSIIHAVEALSVDTVYVSSDCDKILAVAAEYGARPIARPSEISDDAASSESALAHALAQLAAEGVNPELVVFLQCTSPLRNADDIDNAVAELQQKEADSLLSVTASHRFLWQRNGDGTADSVNYDYRRRPRRQDMAKQYMENGSIYVFTPTIFRATGNRLGGKVVLYEMHESSSVDIDNEFDFYLAEQLLTTPDRRT